jgi:hypothetical protein
MIHAVTTSSAAGECTAVRSRLHISVRNSLTILTERQNSIRVTVHFRTISGERK